MPKRSKNFFPRRPTKRGKSVRIRGVLRRKRNGRRRNYLSANNYSAAAANLWLAVARNLLRVAASPPRKRAERLTRTRRVAEVSACGLRRRCFAAKRSLARRFWRATDDGIRRAACRFTACRPAASRFAVFCFALICFDVSRFAAVGRRFVMTTIATARSTTASFGTPAAVVLARSAVALPAAGSSAAELSAAATARRTVASFHVARDDDSHDFAPIRNVARRGLGRLRFVINVFRVVRIAATLSSS